MYYITADGNIDGATGLQDRILQSIYHHQFSRILLQPFLHPAFSKAVGRALDCRISALLVKPFIRFCHIDLRSCEKTSFHSYNDFFTRKLRDGSRPIDNRKEALISPCDGLVSAYSITDSLRVPIKHTWYRVSELLRDRKLAAHYRGGTLLVFRLCVDDYHRYVFPDSGYQGRIRNIQGKLHTVNPVANDVYPIYKENSRSYSILRSDHFGRILMMEVGALLVGRIVNEKERVAVQKGEEKGYFAYGGSTVILMLQKDMAVIRPDISDNTRCGFETKIRQGECVATLSVK